ncbi:hypothetical protein [Alkalihalobacterium alkalinitrilicum]|uniref:hypothetical protein n=1 Tax=Alkalihalobacterium alkalinitrilicum TaxID=427920 RepID=UPI0009957B7B|nr:hypothetical protein [Alkalihalobacterium alkalinitrilicum]
MKQENKPLIHIVQEDRFELKFYLAHLSSHYKACFKNEKRRINGYEKMNIGQSSRRPYHLLEMGRVFFVWWVPDNEKPPSSVGGKRVTFINK